MSGLDSRLTGQRITPMLVVLQKQRRQKFFHHMLDRIRSPAGTDQKQTASPSRMRLDRNCATDKQHTIQGSDEARLRTEGAV